ncbi:MAG: bifunctional phosphoserine phosphatase/homoserine phosphotransferase ThrH [Proteobacteria bacterium]|nr:bifunctional phosphoserine phosphatase/homoserine phosphotransferase ThrH [Pseudomonadota bacterium]
MEIVCLDLEGVLIPEIWIEFAKQTGVDELRMTTRDIPVYTELMDKRLSLLNKNKFKISDIQQVIASMEPLSGAESFLNWLRQHFQVVILSDTYYEFASPLMKKLQWPTLLCHKLVCDNNGSIVDYKIRQPDAKLEAVKSFQNLNYHVFAAGDSYNDTAMLQKANNGFLFCPPNNVAKEFPQFKVTNNYDELKSAIMENSTRFS